MPFNATTCPVGFLSHLPSLANGTNGTDFEHEVAAQVASSMVVAVLLLGASLFSLFVGARLVKSTLFVAAFSITTVFGILAVDAVLAAAPDLAEVSIGVDLSSNEAQPQTSPCEEGEVALRT